ncbi:MAG: type II methionyl aminopeptidase [Nanoarchaeota archaeon]|nr:type II methionyl aminopeptidase [Nanoarchaeota archaeon]
MDDWEKAGKITGEVLNYGKGLIKIDANVLEVVEEIEKKIFDLNAKPAFPTQVSINEAAAHCIPLNNDLKFKENDLVKLDVGVHVNGKIGDSALSVDLGGNKDLIKASEDALNEAIKVVKIGVKINKIGEVIEETIKNKGFKVIKNLSGHEIKEYEEHSGLTIPNFDDKSDIKLKKGQVIAIEPFATTGSGYVEDGKESGIYKILNVKQVRNEMTRDVLKYIAEEYNTLPFSKNWLVKKFSPFKAGFALRIMERENILHHYKQLIEKSKEKVSQSEHTLLVDDEVKVLTKRF